MEKEDVLKRIGLNIRKLRENMGLSLEELANACGYSKENARSSMSKIENGKTDIPASKMRLIAQALQVSPADLMEGADRPRAKGVKIPVYGKVAAGIPIEMIEDITDYEEITEELARTGEFFGLTVRGDSMEPRIRSGDVVICRQQPDAESDQLVIVTVNGDSATCKRLKKYQDGIALVSSNPAYEPMYFSEKEIEEKPVRILGRVVELRAKF